MNLKRALFGFLVIALLLVAAVFIYRTYFETGAGGVAPAADPTASAIDSDIRAAVDSDTVSAEGRIVPLRHASLVMPGSGVVTEIVAPEGTNVAAGQPILRLDAAEQEAALQAAEAALALAQANRDMAATTVETAGIAVAAAELDVRAAGVELNLASAAPLPELIALGEGNLALALAQLAAATAAQAQVLEGAGTAAIRAAEADVQAAEAAAVPLRLRLDELRAQDEPDANELAEAERAYNAALARIEAARVALAEVQGGATAAQRSAAAGSVAAATAQVDAAQAELDLLRAGESAESVAVVQAGLPAAGAALSEAQSRLIAAEADLTRADSEVQAAQAALAMAQAALEDRTLTAPFDGMVASLPFGVGEVVGGGSPVGAGTQVGSGIPVGAGASIATGAPAAIVADFSAWLVETTDLAERDAVLVAEGFPALVTVDALPGETFDGVVTAAGGVGQELLGDVTYPITIRLDDTSGAPLRWGMTVFVTIDITGDADATVSGPSQNPDTTRMSDIVAEGVTLPLDSAALAFQTGGIVAELSAAEGQTIGAGEALIRLDDTAVAAALAQAEAGLATAEAAREAALAAAVLAESQRQAAEAGLAMAEAQLTLVSGGARAEEILAAESVLAAAEANVAGAVAERDAALDVSNARVSAAEAQLVSARAQLTALMDAYDTIITTCVTLPDGSEVCPLLGAPEENARAQVEAAEAAYAAAQAAVAQAQAGATAGERRAADALVAVAVARRDVAAAQLALLQAGARPEQIELAQIGVERARLGLERADIAAREAETTLAQAAAGVQSATAGVAAARAAHERMTLEAPFAGTAAQLDVEVGELVAPGLPVARLGSSAGWVVETSDLAELDVVHLAVGQAATVTFEALPEETLRGTIIDIGRVPETLRGEVVYRVRVALDDVPPDLPLLWGMTARVDFEQ